MDPSNPDTDSEEDRRPRFYVMVWFLAGAMILVVSLRMYIRIFLRKAVGWDDYIICLALALHLMECSFVTLALKYGVMLHIYDLQILPLLEIVKWFTATEITAIITPVIVKLSVCISILRLVTYAQRKVTITIWVLMVVLVTTGLGTFIAFCLQCIPLQKVWKPWIDGKCMKRETVLNNLYYFYGSVCTVTDFICGIIPIYVLYGLQMDRTTKIAVSFLLALVLLPGICSILKTIHVSETLNPDVTWAISGESTWVILEVSLGIIIASLPMLYSSIIIICQHLYSKFTSWSSWRKGESAGSSQLPLKEALTSDSTQRGVRRPEQQQRTSLLEESGEELVLFKRENRMMRRRDAEQLLAQERQERESREVGRAT